MTSATPPLTPIRQYVSPIETSPSTSYRDEFKRRSSSFSSNHDRSPVTPRSRHRFSNASFGSNDFDAAAADDSGEGLGNLADELDQLDDGYEYEEGTTEVDNSRDESGEQESPIDGARDSGIDVSYNTKRNSPTHVRNFSKPLGQEEKPPDEEKENVEDKLSPELEDLVTSIARMTAYTSTTEDPLIPRTTALLQDLGNQTSLEASIQRHNTSTNSMTAYSTTQTKTLQVLSQSLYPIFAFSAPLDSDIVEETIPMLDALIKDLPRPDAALFQRLQKLNRETEDVIQALSQMTDTLQMGKQITNIAARHLRTTQTMVAELLRERERADEARHDLSQSDWGDRLKNRYCGAECKDIISGFESTCDSLRASLEEAGRATA